MALNLVSNGLLDVAGAAAFTALIVQQTKFLVEYVVKPDNSNHDALLRLYVDVVAIAVVVIAQLVSGILNVHNGQDWASAIVQGFGVALASIAGYHLINGLQPQTPAPIPAGNPVGAMDERAILGMVERVLASSAATVSQAIAQQANSGADPTSALEASSTSSPMLPASDAPTAPPSSMSAVSQVPNVSNAADPGGTLASLILQSGADKESVLAETSQR
jgi:hypothetical protein